MKKKLLNIILSITMLLTVMSAASNNVYAEGHPSHNEIDSWTEVSDHLPSASGNYCLTSDITLTGTWNVPTGTTNLCLNGHVINANGGRVIYVAAGSTLNLYDCDNTTSHDGYVDTNSLWHLGAGTGTSKSITGGIITGGFAGGVYVEGTFNMYGGSIAGNTNDHGGGIFVAQNATVKIENGTIENNYTTASGAAVQVDGTFTMSGGTIQNNRASGDGGGISVNGGKGSAKLTGTTKIINNIANGQGGGVSYYGSADKVTLGNKVQISGNTKSDGTANNIYMFDANLYITIGTGADAPADGMKVGVTTYTAPSGNAPAKFTANGTADDVSYFFSDNTGYGVAFKDNHLELYNPLVAYNSTKHVSYNTLADAIAAAESGNEIELWGDNNIESIILPDGVTLYTKSNYSGTVTTNTSGKTIVKESVVGNFQYKYSVASREVAQIGSTKYTSLASAITAAGTVTEIKDDNATTITIISDIINEGCFTIGNSGTPQNIIIDLNGHTIKYDQATSQFSMFTIIGYSKLTLEDFSQSQTGLITSGNNKYLRGFDIAEGTFVFNSGTITCSLADGSWTGAAFDVWKTGVCYMNGGKVTGCSTVNYGGGIHNDGKMYLAGGEITNNTSKNGAGVYNTGTFVMSGGKISNNTASEYGGGVYSNGTSLTLGGKAIIKDNTVNATKDNLYLTTDKLVTIGTPDTNMSVGIRMLTPGKFTTNGSETDTKYFSSDDTQYAVLFNSGNYLELHKHNLVKADGQAPTETDSGWKDYYQCKDVTGACNRYYEDINGVTEIKDLAVWKAAGGRGYLPKITKPDPKIEKKTISYVFPMTGID